MSLRPWEPIVAEYFDKLGAYDEAVVFDDATADRLISAAQTLSSTLTTQGSDRTSWAATASVDFKGHYAEVFDTKFQGRVDGLHEYIVGPERPGVRGPGPEEGRRGREEPARPGQGVGRPAGPRDVPE